LLGHADIKLSIIEYKANCCSSFHAQCENVLKYVKKIKFMVLKNNLKILLNRLQKCCWLARLRDLSHTGSKFLILLREILKSIFQFSIQNIAKQKQQKDGRMRKVMKKQQQTTTIRLLLLLMMIIPQ
jgi:hypothetical protein